MEEILEMYPSLADYEKNVAQDQPETIQVMHSALQTSIESIFIEENITI